MGELNLNSTTASEIEMTDFSVATATTDSAQDQDETGWINDKWAAWFGYFKKIPELNAAINAKATWTVGKGFKADVQTTFICETIKGWGKDTFNTILENMIRTYYIGGDAFAEIIRDDKRNIINLKPLPPETIKIIANRQGIIVRYEQISKDKNKPHKFAKEDIFHLARNRVADEIHGVSVIESVEEIILARNEAIQDYKKMMHRHMMPRYIFHLDTDDTVKIAEFKTKMDKAYADGENLYIPKDVVVPEQMSISPNSTIDPKSWIDAQGDYFYEAVGTPQIIIGGSGEFTEASAKIAYLAWQQNIEEEQLFIEEQAGLQLGLGIELEFPASLENELLSDNKKDGAENIQPNEMTAGSGQ